MSCKLPALGNRGFLVIAGITGWKSQLENDIDPLIAKDQKVWARMDNVYYRKDVEAWYRAKNWDFSISVTNANNCRPVLDFIDGLPDTA